MKTKWWALPMFFSAALISSCNSTTTSGSISSVKKNTVGNGGPQGATDFYVASFSPTEELPSTVKYPSIQIQFSQPVVALEKLGEPITQSDMVTIYPSLKGVFRWNGTSMLSFDCTDDLIPQKEYFVTVNPDLVSTKDEKLSGQNVFSFHTEELKLLSIMPGYNEIKNKKIYLDQYDIAPQYAKDVLLTFSNKVNESVVREFITVTDEKSNSYEFTTQSIDEKSVLLSFKKELPKNSEIEISLAEGAVPDNDCWPTSSEQTQAFHTLKPFTYTRFTGTSDLSISFNHKIKQGSEEKILKSISFSPDFKITKEMIEIKGNTIFVNKLPVTYGDSYQFTLNSSAVTDIYGQTCENKISEKVKVNNADSFVHFLSKDFGILESSFEPKFAYDFQNRDSEYTITSLSGVTANYEPGKNQTFKISPTKEQKNKKVIQVVELKDFLEKIGDSYRGAVKIESKNKSKRLGGGNNYDSFIQVTDLGVTIQSSWNKTDILVASYATGEPIQNADVTMYEVSYSGASESAIKGKGTKLGSAKTNSQGLAVISFKNISDSKKIYVEVKTANDRVVCFVNDYNNVHKPAELRNGKMVDLESGNPIDGKSVASTEMVTKIFSDRGIYRPGETASFKIIDRNLALGEYSNYCGDVEINIVDSSYWSSRHKVYNTVSTKMSEFGTTDFQWTLPEDLKPGLYYVEYKRKDGSNRVAHESFQIQFFERVRFQASAQIAPTVYFSGDSLSASISASYLGGGSLSGGFVRGDWRRNVTTFKPAGEKFKDYTFGALTYSWNYRDVEEGDSFYESSTQNLGEDGKATISLKTGGEPKTGCPYIYSLYGSVTDAGNQVIAANTSAIVHPASFYIGVSNIKNIKGFPKKGEKLDFDLIVTTPDGNVPAKSVLGKNKKISWELVHLTYEEEIVEDEYGFENSNWVEKIIVEQSGTVNLDENKTQSLSVKPADGGSYLLRLKSEDSQGRTVVTEKSIYICGYVNPFWRNQNGIELNCKQDKDLYPVGDTAHILLESPLEKGRYLLTIQREGILSEKVLVLNEPSSVIDVEIKEEYVPVVWVGISTFSKRTGNPKPDYETADSNKPKSVYASVMLSVDTKTRIFDVDVKMDKGTYLPGSQAKIDLTATKNGKPVSNAELTLMVVDRGVLDLMGYKVGNPVNTFYATHRFSNRTYYSDTRNSLIDPVTFGTYSLSPKEIEDLIMYDRVMMKSEGYAVSMASSRACEANADASWDDEDCVAEECEEAGGEEGLQVRKDFRATAVFLPNLVTDKNGKVSTEFKLPDSLTEYVVTVVGVKENNFGYNEKPLTVANPISVRDVETRILRPGDIGESGVVITNIGDKDESVSVDFAVLSGLDKTDYKRAEGEIIRQNGEASVYEQSEKSIVVKSGETKTLMFKIDAKSAGWITLSFKVKSTSVNEIIYKPLEIEKPYIYESVTTVGQINKDESSAEEQIIFPAATDDGRGTFYVQLDSSRLGTLRSAVDYVFHYPYGCMEQRSSAIMPLVAFGEYISVLGLSSQVDNAAAVVKSEINSWGKLQRFDGGFAYWPDGDESSFPVSLRIGEILALAKEHKLSVDSAVNKSKLISYIKSELKKMEKEGYWYPKAYSYYVLSRLGEKINKADLSKIIDSTTGVSEYSFCGLAAFENGYTDLAKSAATKIKNLMSLTTRGASFQSDVPYYGWYFFNGDSERFALALHLFTKLNPEDFYNGHLVYQLLEAQKSSKGRWCTTATTSRVLIALDSYIRANNLTSTDFSAKALLNGNEILAGDFKGLGASPVDSTYRFGNFNEKSKAKDDKFSKDLPKLEVPLETKVPLTISKDGEGLLFYTASMSYAIPAAEQIARDEGLCVYVEITNARTGEKVTGNKLKSGEIYREKVYVTSTKNRTFVAVKAPVPAGATILNSAFATTVTVVPENNDSVDKNIRPYRYWSMSHQDIYDAEIRCFWNNLPIGSQSFDFMFRADRIGEYETPATLAECMYESEIFGRSNGQRWIIE